MSASPAGRRFRASRVGPIGLGMVALVFAIAVLGPLVAADPNVAHRDVLIDADGLPRAPFEAAGHLLGGDPIGRDELARLLHGGRVSIAVAVLATAIAVGIGVAVGSFAGFLGGAIDVLFLFVIDLMLSMPFLLMAMVLRRSIQGEMGILGMATLLGTLSWAGMARVVRARTLTLRQLDYVTAARAMGAGGFFIVTRHILPNLAGPVLAIGTGMVGGMALSEAGLSFLGLGCSPPAASWGGMLQESADRIFEVPRLFAFAAVPLCLTVLGFNLLGQGLRDALDPKE